MTHATSKPTNVGRPGISSLPPPLPRFDLTNTPGFETAEAVADEDRYRASVLRNRASTAKPRRAQALCELADAIDPAVTHNPRTAASSRYMRDQRIRVIGAIWELIDGQ
ncbi:hypothetical protein [Sphingomonas rubra]|uniref:hypothetical protein n=1 Tax=Sphingomonas rubra TaxID=634430 RepID=UPI001160121B|nr:hypothetical protein [Sphingomonas rubra]